MMLEEIRGLISHESKEDSTPPPVKSPFAYAPGFVKDAQAKRKLQEKTKKQKSLKSGRQASTEEIMAYLTSQPLQVAERGGVAFSHEEVRAKSLLMPYLEKTTLADEKVRLTEEWRSTELAMEQQDASPSSPATSLTGAVEEQEEEKGGDCSASAGASLSRLQQHAAGEKTQEVNFKKLFRRYPRLTSMFRLSSLQPMSVKIRSNVWMARFMEECFDEALTFCFKDISDARRRKRCGLDLGALDAFPLIAQRLISRIYSTLDVRQTVCFELLVTLEHIISVGETSLLATTVDSDSTEISIDGSRAVLFSKFLSEELDLDYLAMFLHCRDLVEKDLRVHLADAVQQHILPTPHLKLHATQYPAASTEERLLEVEREKVATLRPIESLVVPHALPGSLQYVLDVTMPLSPMVSFEASKLPWLCGIVAPKASLRLRAYLADRVLAHMQKLLIQGRRRVDAVLQTAGIKTTEKPVVVNLIPVAVFLFIILEEWRAVPVDAKATIGTTGESSESLKKLNDLYDSDNAKAKAMTKVIRNLEAELALCDSSLLKLDKASRRLERKWKTGQASADDLMELQNVRVAQTETKSERTSIETRLHIARRREQAMKDSMEGLWGSASLGTELEVTDPQVDGGEAGLAPSRWREEIGDILESALSYNEESMAAIAKAQEAFKASMHALEDKIAEERDKKPELPREPTLAEQIAALEAEALELSRLGQEEMLELGLVPPAPPSFLQEYTDSKTLQARKELERQEEAAAEARCLEELAAEETEMRKFLDDERFFIEHNCRVMQREEELVRAFVREETERRLQTISSTAVSEMSSIINGALKEIAEATMLRRLDEILQAQAEEQRRALELAELRAKTRKEIEVAVSACITQATNAVYEEMMAEFRSALEAEALRLRLLAISKLAADRVSGVLETSVSKIVTDAIRELLLAKEREYREYLLQQRLQATQAFAANVVAQVVSASFEQALEHYERLELERYERIEVEIDDLSDKVVSSAIFVVAAYEYEDAVERSIELAIDEANELEALRVQQALEAAKVRRHMIYQAKRIAKSLMPMVLTSAMIGAKNVLVDPWRPLTLEPHTFLSEDVLAEVEEMHFISLMKLDVAQKRRFVRGFRYPIIRSQHEMYEKRGVWKYARSLVEERRLREKMACRMQRVARLYLEMKRRRAYAAYLRGCDMRADVVALKYRKRRASKFVRWWKYWAHAEHRAKVVTFNIRERRFLICFYTWRMLFKNAMDRKQKRGVACDKAALIIQCAIRQKLARLHCRVIRATLRIVSLGKRFFARRRVAQLRRRERLLIENQHRQDAASKKALVRRKFQVWRVYFNFWKGLHKLHMFTMRKFVRRRFILWKRGYQKLSALLNSNAVKVQSAVRMWIIKRYVLHFYRFRRGIISLQANARRRMLIPFFRYHLRLFRAAIAIQRSFRGYWTRKGLTARRIVDLHYAASTNNYEKLKYYGIKYRSLLYVLDDEGNTALANAARGGARRTLKLLMRYNLPANAVNNDGYSALHLAIMSSAINRDEVVLYMMERGFDDDQIAPGGKTCLLLAAEYGRGVIVSQLLANGHNANITDESGLTCLQTACQQGFFGIARELISYGADANMPGYCGTVPLHDCIATGNIDFPNLLISNGAYVNVSEPFNGQTPLMWAARAGLSDFVKLYVVQGAHINQQDNLGWTAAHHGATSDSVDVYEELRFGDADFDFTDYEGNTPLHVAGEYGSDNYGNALLLGCCNPSMQNKDGNQASHIAARDNNLKVLKRICVYDTHIGRLNYAHQTPLGMAKFHNAADTRAFLEEHYRKVEIEDGRNSVGDIWWDRQIDAVISDWRVEVGFLGEREYVNDKTGQRSLQPPTLRADAVASQAQFVELPILKKVVLVKEETSLTRHQFKNEYKAFGAEVKAENRIHRASVCIQKWVRRKLCYMALARLKLQKKKRRIIGAFLRRRVKRFMQAVYFRRNLMVSKVQAAFKGIKFRRDFYGDKDGQLSRLQQRQATRILGRKVLRLWRMWKNRQMALIFHIASHLPQTSDEWHKLVVEARVPRRIVGMYEEYLYPGTVRIYFYRHVVSHACTFLKPLKLRGLDEQSFRDGEAIRKYGCTPAQAALTVKLQALWRGYKIRSYYLYVETAMTISLYAEKKYMTSPDTDSHLYNYALHCHCILHDYTRARSLYYESMRRMEWRGPDVAFVLYAYAIFACYTHDLDISDILGLLERGRVAEETREVQLRKAKGQAESQAIAKGTFRHGQVFELANIGFFRNYATEHETEASWHNYALCRFLVFNDFATSFDAFLEAFKYAPGNEKLKTNFDTMMRHFHGPNKKVQQEVTRKRMAYLAQRSADEQNVLTWRRETARERAVAAKKVQLWYRIMRERRAAKMAKLL